MKKIIIVLALVFLSIAFLNAAPGDYDTLKEFIVQQTAMAEGYLVSLEKATDENLVAATLTKIAGDLTAMVPNLKILNEKYPDMEKLLTTDAPEELKVELEKMKAANQKIQPIMMSIMSKYSQSEVVTKAFQEIMKASQALAAAAPKKEEAAPAAETTPPPAKEEQK